MEKKGIHIKYMNIVKDTYEGAFTSMKTIVGDTKEFPITVGLDQGSALGPYLFALVMDELTNTIQDEVPWVYALLIILC